MISSSDINGVNTIRNLSLLKRSLDSTIKRMAPVEEEEEGAEVTRVVEDYQAESIHSEDMRAQVASLTQKIRDLEHNTNKKGAAESAISELREQLRVMREIAVAATEQNGATEEETDLFQQEIAEVVDNFNRQIDATMYGGEKLLNGSEGSVTHISSLPGFDLSDSGSARESVSKINDRLRALDSALVRISAQAREEYEATVKSLEVSSQNLVAAESLLRDPDQAEQQADYVRQIIQLDPGRAALAQGNLASDSVFKLLHT